GFFGPNSARVAISPGISCSARRISLRPNSASERSATLKSKAMRLNSSPEGCALSLRVREVDGHRQRDRVMISEILGGPAAVVQRDAHERQVFSRSKVIGWHR